MYDNKAAALPIGIHEQEYRHGRNVNTKWKGTGILPLRHNQRWLRCGTFTQKKNITALLAALIPLESALSASRLAVVE